MRIIHFVKVRFDIRKAHIDQNWLDTRYQFFIDNTLKSLLNQTNKDWVLWVNFQHGMDEKARKLTDWLENNLAVYVVTFGDGPVHPARLEPYTCDMWGNCGERLRRSDYVYVTRIDSDDLYAPDALGIARHTYPRQSSAVEHSMFRRGYLYNMQTGNLGVYNSPSTPFHTLMIPTQIFLDPEVYNRQVWQRAGDHSRVNDSFPGQILPEYKFTVLIHGHNFISNSSYGRDTGYLPNIWNIDDFLNPPVVFDVDDFCDMKNCLQELKQLKAHYPNFKCTLFTIPEKTSIELMKEVSQLGYVEMCPHGITHNPNEELRDMRIARLVAYMSAIDSRFYKKIFRPPGWYISEEQAKTLSQMGYAVAIHERDRDELRKVCTSGYYVCGERFPYWHGHTHNTCNNWVKKSLLELLIKWPKDQKFAYVREAVLKPTS